MKRAYTEMCRMIGPQIAPGRLENLKSDRSMEEFEAWAAFWRHISLVYGVDTQEDYDAVSTWTRILQKAWN